MQQGRTPPPEPLIAYTVPSTGRTIRLRALPVLARNVLRRQAILDDAEPEPPIVEIDYGDGKLREPNRGDPVYRARHEAWQRRINQAVTLGLTALFLRRGLVVDDDEIDQDAVAAIRATMADVGAPVDAMSDRDVYVELVCIGTEKDWEQIQQIIWEHAAPAEAAVQAQIATFPPDVPGAAAL